MAVDKAVDSTQLDADLASVADAIRTKGGTSAQLAFPAGFVQAIGDIPSGGGGYDLDEIAVGAFTDENVVLSTATFIKPYAFIGNTAIQSISAPYVTNFKSETDGNGSYVFANCINLSSVYLPLLSVAGSGGYQFSGCTSLTAIHLPSLVTPGQYMFSGCTNLLTAVLRATSTGNWNGRSFYGCSKLKAVDATGSNRIYTDEFHNAAVFDTLVLRRTSGVVSLNNINSFSGTPFASGGSGGTLYVPGDLISSYQSATNWSTILGYANNQIKSIESTHTDPTAPIDLTLYYVDGTPIPT